MPVVVVGQGPDDAAELRRLRRYLREMKPVVIATGDGLDGGEVRRPDPRRRGARRACRGAAPGQEPPRRPRRRRHRATGRRAGRAGPSGSSGSASAPCPCRPRRSPADAALLLADAAGATPIVGVGLRGTLEEFLDGSRDGLGSGYVTRLKVGPRLVDATAVPMLYSGQLRARHAYLVLLIGLIAVAAAHRDHRRRPPVGPRPA